MLYVYKIVDLLQGWLPGQGHTDAKSIDTTCLSLQWKVSPKPLLASGLYWIAQKCSKIGGYICKKRKVSASSNAYNTNFIVTGREGRLMSPGNFNNLAKQIA